MKYTPKSACVRRNWNSKCTKIFGVNVLTLYSTDSEFLSYDLTALGFSVMTFLHGDIELA